MKRNRKRVGKTKWIKIERKSEGEWERGRERRDTTGKGDLRINEDSSGGVRDGAARRGRGGRQS